MAAEPGGHQLALLVDSETARESAFPAGLEVVTVDVAERPTEAAGASSARSPLDLLRFRRAASRYSADALFFPAIYSYFPAARPTPTIVTLHDAIAEKHPDQIFSSRFRRTLWNWKVRAAVRRADRLVTVSEYSRRDVAEVFGVRADSIAVLGEGVTDFFAPSPPEDVLEKHSIRGGFFLYVGGISPHKNLSTLVRALSYCSEAHLVIVGDYETDSFLSSYQDIRALLSELGCEDRVRFTGFVPDEELAALYSACLALVIPSIDEGFCLPAAEAMACGAPVAASDAGALPETLGDAALYFPPHDAQALAETLRTLLRDATRRAHLRELGLARARRYRWSDAAQRAWELLGTLA